MCRQRIGTAGDHPSQHSFANALDISAFVTADGRSIDVFTGWGQTARTGRHRRKATSSPAVMHARGATRVRSIGVIPRKGNFCAECTRGPAEYLALF
jgi:Extensin-like protein C-terminus